MKLFTLHFSLFYWECCQINVFYSTSLRFSVYIFLESEHSSGSAKMMRVAAVLISQCCVEFKNCIFSSRQPTRSHVKPIYLAGGKSFFSCVHAVVREVHGRGFGNVCLCSPGSFMCVGVHSFEEHLGNAFKQMEVLIGVFPSKITSICFCSSLF